MSNYNVFVGIKENNVKIDSLQMIKMLFLIGLNSNKYIMYKYYVNYIL